MYIYVIEIDNKIKISFDTNLNNRRFNFGKGVILLQFYTDLKNLYKNIINELLNKFTVIDSKEYIFNESKKTFINEVIKLKEKYQVQETPPKKKQVKVKTIFTNKEQIKVQEQDQLINKEPKVKKIIKKIKKTSNDNETIEQKRENKIKKQVEKKFKMSFDSLAYEVRRFLLLEDNKNYGELVQLYRNPYLKEQIKLVLKYFCTDDDYSKIDYETIVTIILNDHNGPRLQLIDFDEIIELKQEIPKLNFLRFAEQQVKTKEQFKIYEREYLKDKYDGFLMKTNRRELKKKYSKQLKYKFEDMKYIKGELTKDQLINLAQNTKLNEKIYKKYFSNIEKEKLSELDIMFNTITPYEHIKNNLIKNPNISDHLIKLYFE
jgi:hypothetical protein